MANVSFAGGSGPAQAPLSFRLLWSDVRGYWPLWLIVAAAIALRIHEMGRVPGLHGDEAWYGIQARTLLEGSEVSWRTPTGNVPGVVQLGSLALLHSIFSPSLLLLRIPALLSSLAAMGLAYATARRFFGATAGMAALVLMACLPINIAYARFGWDPSHSAMLILLATYALLANRRLLSVLIFALALSNHPAAVFVAPFLTMLLLCIEFQRQHWRPALMRGALYAALLLVAILFASLLAPGARHYLSISGSVARLLDPDSWLAFVAGFCRLLSGDTVYAFVAGQGFGPERPATEWITGLILAGVSAAGIVALRRRPDWPTIGVVAGWLVSLFLLFAVAGLWVLRPMFERFSFPMIPLTALAVAVVLGRYFRGSQRNWLFQALMTAIALPMLVGFWFHYLKPLDSGGARPNPGFWTGRVEPNQAAFSRIAAAAGSAGNTRIVAENWWVYGPIAYFAVGESIVMVDARKAPTKFPDEPPGGTYWITYRGGKLDRELAHRGDVQHRWTIATSNRENALSIWWKPPPPGLPSAQRPPLSPRSR